MGKRPEKPGRKPLPPALKQSKTIAARFTPSEFRLVKKAKPRGVSFSEWTRQLLLEVARKAQKGA
jgi:hypothetical protein